MVDHRIHPSLSEGIRYELLQFCQNTTIRGVPRIVKARNKTLQTLWIVFEVLLFFGCFVCMFFLARQYLAYDVIHPPRVLRDSPSPFPSITICNLRPISSKGIENLSMQRLKVPRTFAEDVNAAAAYFYYHRNLKEKYQYVTSALSMGGYLESLPEGVASTLGHSLNDTIIYCMVSNQFN
ncbi:unnamed protein product [Protopolystoma xenopodis]|uniref:Uncharacterized protein n=1 Tax=Protopolystoma xenopodis TaxID=117903 RepID=A0A448WUF1_9PLAT|nr:unnamed protein product [Protopolystoma xenopodis]